MKALIKIQSELKVPKNQYNSFGKYKYRNAEDILEAVKPLLSKEGLLMTISDELVQVGTRIYIMATVSITDGDTTISTNALAREPEIQKGMNDSQITGSTSSYARKYALNGMFCIDDTKDADSQDNTKQPVKVETKKETEWLTEGQFNKAINSGMKGINATIKAYSFNNGKAMKKEYKTKLEAKLKTLSEIEAIEQSGITYEDIRGG